MDDVDDIAVERSAAVECVDLAVASLDGAHKLLDRSAWGDAVSMTESRTLWSMELPRAGLPDGQLVRSVRLEAVVSGVDPEVLRRLLQDYEFWQTLSADDRWLEQVIVRDKLWVLRQSVCLDVPHIRPREFTTICGHAELASGAKLLIEQSTSREEWPPPLPLALRGYRYLAIALHPVATLPAVGTATVPPGPIGEGVGAPVGGSSASAHPSAPAAHASHAGAGSSPGAASGSASSVCDAVRIVSVLQCDLGPIAERFTDAYALESSELTDVIRAFIARPEWPTIRQRLLEQGPRLPPCTPEVSSLCASPSASCATLTPPLNGASASAAAGTSTSAPTMAAPAPAGDLDNATALPPHPFASDDDDFASDTMARLSLMHHAQVQAFTQNRGPMLEPAK